MEIGALFDWDGVVIDSHDQHKLAWERLGEEIGKPHPEVFLKAAEEICRAPQNCVVFEDAHVGIEAGLAAGCKVISVATTNDISELGKADAAVDTLEDVDWPLIRDVFR